jgi:hypothetical protein
MVSFALSLCRKRPLRAPRRALRAVVLVVSALTASTATAAAPPKQFLAILNAPQETPPVATAGNGAAHLTFDEGSKMLCFSINFQNLGSAEILAHIHGPALPGTPAGILFPLPLGNPKTGCVGPLDKNQKSALLKNTTYINIHTTGFPAGEIRGQILRIK